MGSPKMEGNTARLCKSIIEELEAHNADIEYITLHGKNITPCIGCHKCQNAIGEYGCIFEDDMQGIVDVILKADVLVFATPIYTWQATTPMKAVMDRMYGLNKFYGEAPREVLNQGQKYALLATHGYDADYAAGPLNEVMRRWAEHSGLDYLGMYGVKDEVKDVAKNILNKQTPSLG